jgi:hypothetical protein
VLLLGHYKSGGLLLGHYKSGGLRRLFCSHLQGSPSRHVQDVSKISRRKINRGTLRNVSCKDNATFDEIVKDAKLFEKYS